MKNDDYTGEFQTFSLANGVKEDKLLIAVVDIVTKGVCESMHDEPEAISNTCGNMTH